MYVRVQLSEEPVWLRAEGGDEVLLLHEARSREQVGEIDGRMQVLTLDNAGDVAKDLRTLSIERGDATPGPPRARVDVASLVERATSTGKPVPPNREHGDEDLVEGYKPRKELLKKTLAGGNNEEDEGEDDDGDILDTI